MTLSVAVLTEDPDGPSARHRWARAAPYLSEAGVEVALHPVEPKTERPAALRAAAAADLTVIHRKLFRLPDLVRLLRVTRKRGKRIVYDLDDAVMYRPSGRRRQVSILRGLRFSRTVRKCSLYLAGNEYLLSRAAQRVRGVIQPTPVEVARHPVRGDWPERGTTVGWIGTEATLPYLRAVAGPLAEVAAARGDLVLRVIGPEPEPMPGVRVEHVPWSDGTEAEAIRALDVGILPLPDDRWTRGKCAFKALQYMAAGLPVLASPVGVNRDVVVEGKTGFLPKGPGEWAGRLGRLLGDAALRESMGRAGRAHVEERYATSVLAAKLAARLKAVAG